MNMDKLDQWQKEVLEAGLAQKNIALRSARQCGKSTVVSILAGELAVRNANKTIMIIAAVERQAQLLFDKTLNYITDNYRKSIKLGKDRPTRHIITLVNGSKIYCLPCGLDGSGIRGYTVDMLIVDEAAFVPEPVYQAVSPMLSITKGNIILLSTPAGRDSYFFHAFHDPHFINFHIRWSDCPRHTKDFIEMERTRMSKMQFQQEYEAEFVDELMQFFPSDLIDKCLKDSIPVRAFGENYLGVDVARMGRDDSVFYGLQRRGNILYHVTMAISSHALLTESIKQIKLLDQRYDFKRIYIDSAGVGGGVFDVLLDDDQTKRKIVPIDNARRNLDRKDEKKKTLMKEDIYMNLLRLMENDLINLPKNPDLRLSLRGVTYEYIDDGKGKKVLRIFSPAGYDHIAEALVRAAWCVMDKKNKPIWCR